MYRAGICVETMLQNIQIWKNDNDDVSYILAGLSAFMLQDICKDQSLYDYV